MVLGVDIHESLQSSKDRMDVVKGRTARALRPAPLTVNALPLLLFSMTILPMGTMYDIVLGYIALVTAIALSLGFTLMSRALPWRVLAASCFAASLLGPWMGFYDRAKYLDSYHVYKRTPSFSDVQPTTSPAAYSNAGFVSFSPGTKVDITRGLGHQAGKRYCVAPVVGEDETSAVGYWAVGTGCCEQRGLFSCGGNLTKPDKRNGVVLMNVGAPGQSLSIYESAVEQAAVVYGIPLPQQDVKPMLVFWNTDFDSFVSAIYSDAVTFCLLAMAAFLLMVPVYSVVLSVLGLSLFGQSKSFHWHPDVVDQMTIGVDLQPRDYPPDFQDSFLRGRCYYSGEVVFDYVFHMANRHFFLGCFLAHPAHPFSKRERIAVALIIMPLVVFPIAAFSLGFAGETGWERTLFILFIVAVPRNVLTWYLQGIATEDSVMVLEEGATYQEDATQRSLNWEIGVLAICAGITLVVSVLCWIYINSHLKFSSQDSALDVILQNCDGLGYIFVLDILFDIALPKELKGSFLIGFFQRWRVERDEVEVMKKAKLQQLEQGAPAGDHAGGSHP